MITNDFDALVVTAIDTEYQAVKSFLSNIGTLTHAAGTIYSTGVCLSGERSASVAFFQTGMGNVKSGIETERALQFLKPRIAIFIGVAGGLKDVGHTDIVVANQVYGFEYGKETEVFQSRPESYRPSYELLELAKNLIASGEWKHELSAAAITPHAFIGPIAAGEKVLASAESPSYNTIRKYFSNALAIEMEGLGFLSALYRNNEVPSLIVRGISDLVSDKNPKSDLQFQPAAAKNAAAFAFSVIFAHKRSSGQTQSIDHQKDGAKQLQELAIKLYPRGPVDQNIWDRAGGDISTLRLGEGGRADWYSALTILSNGGGGSHITKKSLLELMAQDYANNEQILQLLKIENELN
jgi:adenosylhomocysteine nucleosidase